MPYSLNPEQLAAVKAGAGAWSVLAGPGSGKTTVLISRYQRLLAAGVAPAAILCLTFTKAAADEMQKRAGVERNPNEARPSGFRTFHALSLAFITAERAHLGYPVADFPLLDGATQAKFLGEACRKQRVPYKRLAAAISEAKRNRLTPAATLALSLEPRQQSISRGYQHYENACRAAGLLDFDSLLTETVRVLETNEEVRARWQYEYLCVDETQDCDQLNYDAVKLLSAQHGNVYCVGDPGQSVYAFRSARPELFLNFRALFPDAQTLYLARNHRSSPQIVNLCRQLAPVPELGSRFATSNPDGPEPAYFAFASDRDEAAFIAQDIDQAIDNGTPAEQHAILARTNRQLVALQMALAERDLPYRLAGADDFWKQPEIKAALAYAQLAVGPTDAAVLGALHAPFDVTRFLKKKDIAAWLAPCKGGMWRALTTYTGDAAQQNIVRNFLATASGLRSLVANADAMTALRSVLTAIRAFDHYAADDDLVDIAARPLDNLRELVKIAGRFPTLPEFLDHTRRLQAAARKRKGVTLSTVHGAKGKEWPTVYVAGCAEGLLPHQHGEIAEEGRILFVAISRAERRLVLTWHGPISRFLAPLTGDVPVRNMNVAVDSDKATQTLMLIGGRA